MKRLFMAVILLVITAPTLAHSIRYTVEGTYKNWGSPDNLLIPVEGKFTGWFEFDPGKSSYWNTWGGPNYYGGGFTFKFYIEGIRLFSKISDYYFDPSKELKAGNLNDINGYEVDFYPWSDDNWYNYSEPLNFGFNETTNRVGFYINSPPCCEDRYYEIGAVGKVIRTEVFVPEPSTALLLGFSLLFLLAFRGKKAKH